MGEWFIAFCVVAFCIVVTIIGADIKTKLMIEEMDEDER